MSTLQEEGVTQLRLHKLLFYCQAASLVWRKQTLFDEPIEAWANGPVVPSIWRENRYRTMVTMENLPSQVRALDQVEMSCVAAVCKAYGAMSGGALSNQTHDEEPWIEARRGLADGAHGAKEISPQSMQEFYSRAWST